LLKKSLLALLLACSLLPTAWAQSPSKALHQLFEQEWERNLRDRPESASYQGDQRFNDRWSDLSLPAFARREQADRVALQRLQAIDRSALSSAEQLDYDTFEWQQQRLIERQKFREHLLPISHQGGPQTADGIAEVMPFANGVDYRNYLARMAALPLLVDQVIALMQEGVKAGLLPPKVLMNRVPAQLAAQIVDDPALSPFYRPFKQFPATLPPAEQALLQASAKTHLRDQVIPAYRKLQAYFLRDYLPLARPSISATDRPDGQAYYDFLARYYTTTAMGSEAIHALGLSEVARLSAAMEAVMRSTGFSGSMAAFQHFLRTDPRFFRKTPEELLASYRAVAKRIDPELVKVFKTQPRLPYGVRAIPDNLAPDTTTAYYQGGAADGTRAGYYYVNLYKPETRPTWEMIPLSLHEAVPGHHFQFARALELPGLPMFRKTAYFVAYGEGWALYAEQLGYEMGLYDDPYDRFGQLTYEMWRAVRLVVDTGMHAKGWSREQAIAYFKANTAKTEQDIINEIDRYIDTPAQALAYKIGQLKISELRAMAQRELGPRFDLRDFNDAVLDTGSVPLAALTLRIEAWIKARR
jgi:uncharacterized protein (DUF885 family)